jgi:hypothetical protein
MLLPPEKYLEMLKKIEQKIPRLSIDILCMYIKFCKKPTFFMTCVKKTKKRHVHCYFFAPKFVFFTRDSKNISFP